MIPATPSGRKPPPPRRRPAAGRRLRLRRILVPLDFSPAATEALRFARPFAEECGARLDLLHVLTPLLLPAETSYLPPDWSQYELSQRREAADHLERLARQELPSGRFEILVESGHPTSVISRVAAERRSDWVVLSTHGSTGLKRFLLGSTAEGVVRHAPCPVLTVRQPLLARTGTPNTPPSERINRVLVPVDFSAPSHNLLRYAGAFAATFRASLHLLHVVERISVPTRVAYAATRLQGVILQRGLRQLSELAASLGPPCATAEQTVRVGSPYDLITQLARLEPADLILVATHGHTGLRYRFLGSTVERVVRHAPCPVLVVR